MLEQNGTVVACEQEWLWVESQARSACSSCGASSCSTSVLGKLFGTRQQRLRLRNTLNAVPGQQVVIGIPEQVLVAASVRAYLMPLLVLIAAAGLARELGLSDAAQGAAALGGLFLAFGVMKFFTRVTKYQARYAPVLLRKMGAVETSQAFALETLIRRDT